MNGREAVSVLMGLDSGSHSILLKHLTQEALNLVQTRLNQSFVEAFRSP